jgi:hypothetical protein
LQISEPGLPQPVNFPLLTDATSRHVICWSRPHTDGQSNRAPRQDRLGGMPEPRRNGDASDSDASRGEARNGAGGTSQDPSNPSNRSIHPERPPRRRRLNWKTVAVVVVALLVVGPFARQLFAQVGPQEKAVDTTGSGRGNQPSAGTPATPASGAATGRKGSKRSTVDLGGQAIPAGSTPTILLNPGLVRPGTTVGVSGFGFDPGGLVDVSLVRVGSSTGTGVATAKVDKNGAFTATFGVPENPGSNTPSVVATQRNTGKTARARAMVPAGIGTVKVAKQVGKPGDRISLTASGFTPGESVKVYWGTLSGQPATTLQTDQGGGIGQVSLRVPVAAVGNSTLALVGDKSQTVATSPFTVLSLYPTVSVAPYAVKAANRVGFAGRGFGPDERVLVYVNSTSGLPVMVIQADSNGAFSGAGFLVPFGLKQQQSLVLIGELSRAVVSSGFMVLPYTPTAQPSTYGGAPGTSLTFYATGFAANEVVLVYKHRTRDSAGELVGAFRADGKGRAASSGQYTIAGDSPGKLTFTLVGRRSGGVATAAVQVQGSDVPVQVPPQPKYSLPPDLQDHPSPSPSAAAGGAQPSPSSSRGTGATRATSGAAAPAQSPSTAPALPRVAPSRSPQAAAAPSTASTGRGAGDRVSTLWKDLLSRI